MIRLAAIAVLLCCASGALSAETPVESAATKDVSSRPLLLDSKPMALGGVLKRAAPLWAAYKAKFITDSGRLLDTGNHMISHSEGQGYAMLLAVASGDRDAFDRLWGWTRANLMVRDDSLIAWRWEPRQRPAVADLNDAADGDILVAWALTEAAEYWSDSAYRAAARRIAVEVGRKLILTKTPLGAMLLPAVSGFATEDRADGPVLNPSYWVFPAFARLPLVAPEVDWRGLTEGGLNLIKAARFGSAGLPTDWVSEQNGVVHPAEGFAQYFGYNAIRVPLYLAWAGIGDREHYAGFVALAQRQHGASAIVDVAGGGDVQPLGETGYAAIGALALCATESQPISGDVWTLRIEENYYPVTLRLLVLAAAQMRYPSCLRS
jgi:endo-1,4-beta-D-glucanase Y